MFLFYFLLPILVFEEIVWRLRTRSISFISSQLNFHLNLVGFILKRNFINDACLGIRNGKEKLSFHGSIVV